MIIGVILTVWSIYWQVYLWAAGAFETKTIQAGTFIDHYIDWTRASWTFGFMSTIYFYWIILWLFASIVHGQLKFGMRFFQMTVYPMVPGETFVNSFLINALILNVYTPALTYFIVDMFRGYLRGTQVSLFYYVIARNQYFI